MTDKEEVPPQSARNWPIGNPRGIDESNLNYLESFEPFQYDQQGNILRGTIPQTLLEENWDLLNQHVALGNFDKEDIKIMYFTTKRNTLNTIKNIPRNKFTVHRLRELHQIKTANFLLATKSKREGERDRKLIPAVVNISQQESRSTFKEEAQQQKKPRWGGMLNPINWL